MTAAQTRTATSLALEEGAEGGENSAVFSINPDAKVERARRVWGSWLTALESDSEAAMAAALAYRQQSPEARDCWLDALLGDLAAGGASRVAALVPLLAVECDRIRSARIARALQPVADQLRHREPATYLWGKLEDGVRLGVVIAPVYLDFVQVLAIAYVPGESILWVRHDPIASQKDCPQRGHQFESVMLETALGHELVDELALTILAMTRRDEAVPEAVKLFSNIFSVAKAP